MVRHDVDINATVDLLVGSIYAAYVAGEEHAFDAETIVDTLLVGIATDALG